MGFRRTFKTIGWQAQGIQGTLRDPRGGKIFGGILFISPKLAIAGWKMGLIGDDGDVFPAIAMLVYQRVNMEAENH